MKNIAVIWFEQDYNRFIQTISKHTSVEFHICSRTRDIYGTVFDDIIYLFGYEKMDDIDRIIHLVKISTIPC